MCDSDSAGSSSRVNQVLLETRDYLDGSVVTDRRCVTSAPHHLTSNKANVPASHQIRSKTDITFMRLADEYSKRSDEEITSCTVSTQQGLKAGSWSYTYIHTGYMGKKGGVATTMSSALIVKPPV